jgi:hypothetical protein
MLVTPFLTCVSENPIAKLLQRVSRVFEVVDDKKGGEHGHDHGHTNRYYYHRALSHTQLRGIIREQAMSVCLIQYACEDYDPRFGVITFVPRTPAFCRIWFLRSAG